MGYNYKMHGKDPQAQAIVRQREANERIINEESAKRKIEAEKKEQEEINHELRVLKNRIYNAVTEKNLEKLTDKAMILFKFGFITSEEHKKILNAIEKEFKQEN